LLEKEVEKYLKKRVENSGGWALKFISPGISGVPDRIILYPGGQIYFVELKSPTGRTRILQKKIQKMLRRFGFPVYTINSKEAADNFIWEVTCNE